MKDDFIGQTHWRSYFASLLKAKRLSHAYLFSGPKHIGKHTFVRTLTKDILCQNPDSEGNACQKCLSCRAWRGEWHPSQVELRCSEDKESIGVEDVRQFIVSLSRAPHITAYQVGLISEVDTMTTPAFHVLLKTIEEPPASVILFLVTENPERLPATVRSRLEHCVFSPVALKELSVALKKHIKDQTEAEELASLCSGRPGLALYWLTTPGERNQYIKEGKVFLDLLASDLTKRFAATESMALSEDWPTQKLNAMLSHWAVLVRDIILTNSGAISLVSHHNFIKQYEEFAQKDLSHWLNVLSSLEKTRYFLSAHANRRLTLNNFLANI